jgi:hypothetical protein
VTQEQVLEDEVAAAAERRGDDPEQERDQFEHSRSMTDRGCEPREVLPSDHSIIIRGMIVRYGPNARLHCSASTPPPYGSRSFALPQLRR